MWSLKVQFQNDGQRGEEHRQQQADPFENSDLPIFRSSTMFESLSAIPHAEHWISGL